ncbi:thermonuclease family protein [Fervidobacterium sp. 2310opik-2]|uniref:thermonuclease family protein n=1 Tax=Fervidobacterium sp. 2310opik-2 TaxID=1755815 RepID=UPI0013E066A1|nr:thermonuclease family protein [Fervidobacterium sp. 2310opik-2]KAF2962243.1 hypothetical protein AS161_04680 [Fervidobacterium sp. 2310opik-2]
MSKNSINHKKTIKILYIITLAIFILTLSTCQNPKTINYTVSIALNLPSEITNQHQNSQKTQNSFSEYQISKSELLIYNGENLINSFETNNLNFSQIQLPKGNYKFVFNAYYQENSQELLFFYGTKNVNIDSNTTVYIDTRLASGTANINFLTNDQNFDITQATITLLNQANGKILTLNSNTNNIEIYPGVWKLVPEIIARNQTNPIDKRYSAGKEIFIYIRPSQNSRNTITLPIPPEEKIGAIRQVNDVHDGDTFRDSNNNSYRIIGIDTPEVSAGTKPVGEFNQEAKQMLENFVNSGNGYVRVISKGTDSYGRYLVYVFNDSGKRFFEEEILKAGYARPLFYDENADPELTPRLINAYRYAYENKNGIYSKWDTAPIIENTTQNKDSYVGKIVWLKGTVSKISYDSSYEKWTITLDNGWAKIEIRNEEYTRLFNNENLSNLNNKQVKFYGELWNESGIYKILLRASWEYVIIN